MKEKIKHFSLLTVSTLIMAVGTYFFKFTNNFTFGGITGLAVLVADKTSISASDFSFIVNMLLLILGFIVLGKKFAAKTAYCSILLSVALSTLERVCPMDHPLTDQTMLELCFAIALPALGSAILFNIGSSSGGTDIIAMILKRYSSFDIGKALLVTDILITVAGCFVFDIQTGLYSFLGLTIRSLITLLKDLIYPNILMWSAMNRKQSVIFLCMNSTEVQRSFMHRGLFPERTNILYLLFSAGLRQYVFVTILKKISRAHLC